MKVGLLECDHVREELLHIDGDYRQMFPSLFTSVAMDWHFTFYDVCNGHFPSSADECEVYICTGSRFSVYDNEDWIIRLKQFVKEIYQSGKVYLGVCFGHQMLAEALGGKVEKSPKGWCVGVHTFDMMENEDWMNPSMPSLNLLMMCQDQIIKLPPNSTVLATEPDCPVAMFRIGTNMLGVQAHPEFSKTYDKALMELRVERIGQQKVDEGIASLELPVYENIMAEWMKNFAQLMKK
ncbi:glutamine amidotransferase-related protein [Dyadobacter arcticus]|uniref:GMP synthase-like glutamine amidotransferase n=1 Tax=Dyadobacter arcticus TaxID=1078754 RepID=A0ABX0UJ86_9BACT|nr:amidotransferase [Dyadobacter arcticus]NIJ51630.1 GMP synthase-like glutamine amidotransferase [Dyadobacter arcticus]